MTPEEEDAALLAEFQQTHGLTPAAVRKATKVAAPSPSAATVEPTASPSKEDASASAEEFLRSHGISNTPIPQTEEDTASPSVVSPGDAALAGGAAGWLAGRRPLQSAAYGSAEASRLADAAAAARAGSSSAAESLLQARGAHATRVGDLMSNVQAMRAGVDPARQALEQAIAHAQSVGALAPEVTALDVIQHAVPKSLANPATASLAREVSQQVGTKSRFNAMNESERLLEDLYRRGVVSQPAKTIFGNQGPLVSSSTGRVLLPQSAAAALEPTAAEVAAKQGAMSRVSAAHIAHEEAKRAAAAAQLAFEKAHSTTSPIVDSATALSQRSTQAVAEAEEAARLAQLGKESKFGLSNVGRIVRRIPGLGILSGGLAGYDLAKAYEEGKAGHYGNAALKGLSGVGGLVSMIPTPMTVGAGALMQAPELANMAYDWYKNKP